MLVGVEFFPQHLSSSPNTLEIVGKVVLSVVTNFPTSYLQEANSSPPDVKKMTSARRIAKPENL